MKSRRWLLAVAMAAGLTGLVASASAAKQSKKASSVTLEQLPQPAKMTLRREIGHGRIVELLRKFKKGREYYHADVRIGPKEGEIDVAPDGAVLRREFD